MSASQQFHEAQTPRFAGPSTEAPPHQAAIPEELPDLLRQGIRGDVEILRLDADEQISYAAANEERLEAPLAQPIEHSQSIRRNLRP